MSTSTLSDKNMTEQSQRHNSGNSRTQVFRVIILLVFSLCLFFVSLEVVLRVIGYGAPSERVDPFQGFEGTNPIFQEIEIPGEGSFYVASPNKSYIDQRFSTIKGENVYRIFAFGGSTTEGVPWGRKNSFPAQLQESLQIRIPSKNIEVINVGVAGYASSRVLEILKETLEYQPDLFVVYTGQNEFRDAHFHKRELRRSSLWANVLSALYRSRAVFLIAERSELLLQKIIGKRIVSYAAESIEAVVARPFTHETFQSFAYYRQPELIAVSAQENKAESSGLRDEEDSALVSPKSWIKNILGETGWKNLKAWMGLEEMSEQEVYGIFEDNVRTMIDMSQQHGVKVIFVSKAQNTKVMNLQSPYRINPNKFFENGKIEEWNQHYSQGVAFIEAQEFQQALASFLKVREIYNPSYRDQDYLLALYIGECYEQLGKAEQAREEYKKRLPASHKHLNTILHSVAREKNVPVVDAHQILARKAKHGVVGYNYFVDTVHMTLSGYGAIGLALADFIATEGVVSGERVESTVNEDITDSVLADEENMIVGKDFPADVHTSLGWSAFNQGKLEKGLFWGRQAVKKKPDDVQAHLLLGYVYAKQGREEQAKQKWGELKNLWKEMEVD